MVSNYILDQKEVEWEFEKELDQFKGKFKNLDDIKGFIEILKVVDQYGIYSFSLKEVLSELITEWIKLLKRIASSKVKENDSVIAIDKIKISESIPELEGK